MTVNILLINPPISLKLKKSTIEKLHNTSPPLGLAYLASMVRDLDVNLRIIDAHLYNMGKERIKKIIENSDANVIGISTTTASARSGGEIARIAKEVRKDTLVIIGGPHIAAVGKDILEVFNEVDIAVAGDGEEIFRDIITCLLNKKDIKNVKGIIYRNGSEIKINEKSEFLPLDEIPFPAWDLLPPLENYSFQPACYKRKPHTFIVASRGCPYKCNFCHIARFKHKIRFRSPKNVVDEIEFLIKKYNVKEVRFADEIFTVKKEWTYSICDEIIKRNLDISWTCDIRADHMSQEMANKLKEAGCWGVSVGIESGSERILKRICKEITKEQVINSVRYSHNAGLEVRAFFMLGFPFETEEDIKETIRFSKEIGLDYAQFSYVVPFPGTEIYDIGVSEGIIGKYGWLNYNASVYEKPFFTPKGMTKDNVEAYFKQAYRQFYLRPHLWVRRILSIRSIEDVRRYLRGAIALFGI